MIQISSWDTSQVLAAVEALLKASQGLALLEGRIERGGEINVNPDKAPWCGIYKFNGQFPIRTLGFGNGFRRQHFGVAIIVQNVSRTSGAACQDGLGQFEKAIVDAILSDTSLGGTMDVVEEFNVSYPPPATQGTNVSFQSSIIQFNAVKDVGISGG